MYRAIIVSAVSLTRKKKTFTGTPAPGKTVHLFTARMGQWPLGLVGLSPTTLVATSKIYIQRTGPREMTPNSLANREVNNQIVVMFVPGFLYHMVDLFN